MEHFYQACKATTEADFDLVRNQPTPQLARQAGQRIRLRDDWEEAKVDVMIVGVGEKFSQNPELRELLLATGDRELVEHCPEDKFWAGSPEGQNELGSVLMMIRGICRIQRDGWPEVSEDEEDGE